MKRSICWIIFLGAILLVAAPAVAGDEVTLEGTFVWEREEGNRDGPLKAVFTPSGDDAWSVSFHFDWEDGAHVYSGTCNGSLTGELSGDVVSDGGRSMSFKFEGSFEDGTFSGVHSFVTEEGEIKRAGTLTLAAP